MRSACRPAPRCAPRCRRHAATKRRVRRARSPQNSPKWPRLSSCVGPPRPVTRIGSRPAKPETPQTGGTGAPDLRATAAQLVAPGRTGVAPIAVKISQTWSIWECVKTAAKTGLDAGAPTKLGRQTAPGAPVSRAAARPANVAQRPTSTWAKETTAPAATSQPTSPKAAPRRPMRTNEGRHRGRLVRPWACWRTRPAGACSAGTPTTRRALAPAEPKNQA